MFDYIKKEECKKIPCPYCGNEEMEYQTKDSDCELDQLSIKDVDNFYDSCSNCKNWVNFTRTSRVKDNLLIEEYVEKYYE